MYNETMIPVGKTIIFTLEDAVTSVGRFPLWWYTRGFLEVGAALLASLRRQARSLALGVWMRNLFTPMYGRYDWQSRLISVIVRFFQIIGRGLFVCVLASLYIGLFLLYLAAPVVAVFGLLFHLFGSFF